MQPVSLLVLPVPCTQHGSHILTLTEDELPDP
jgi:hypothetical protein